MLRGKPGQMLVSAASQAGDLLVIATGRRGSLRQLLGCPVLRYCLGNANCPVLAIPPPALTQKAVHGRHGWAYRHPKRDLGKVGLLGSTS